MAYLKAIQTLGSATIDPDPTVIAEPYLALRSVGDSGGVVGDALRRQIIKWRFYLSGSYTYTTGGGASPLFVFTSTFDAVCDIVMTAPANESYFGKINPPDGTEQRNAVLYSPDTAEIASNDFVIGSWSITLDGVPTSNGDMVIAPDSVTINDCEINTDFGWDEVNNIFGIKFKLTIPMAAAASGMPPLSSDVVFRLATEPASLGVDYQTQTPMTISALGWEDGAADNVEIPIYSDETARTLPGFVSSVLVTNISMMAYGQAPTSHPETTGLVLAWGDANVNDDSDGSRTWNQDSTAHRNPITRELL